MITREQAQERLYEERVLQKRRGQVELLETIIALYDQIDSAYMQGALAGMRGDIDPENLPEEE